MHQADSDRYLRFLGRFRIVGYQYGSYCISHFCHLEFGGGPWIFGKFVTPV